MRALRLRVGLFLCGVSTALLVLVILAVAGVLPVKSEKTITMAAPSARLPTTCWRAPGPR